MSVSKIPISLQSGDFKNKMADVGSVKTLHNFGPLKPFAASTIQAVTLPKRRKILLLSNGSEFLYLVEDDTLIVSN